MKHDTPDHVSVMRKPNERTSQILEVAISIAKDKGIRAVTREAVSTNACVSPALVNVYFKSMRNLRQQVVREAIARRHVDVLTMALAERDPIARDAPLDLKIECANYLIS